MSVKSIQWKESSLIELWNAFFVPFFENCILKSVLCNRKHSLCLFYFFYKIVFKRKYVIYRNQKKRYFFKSVVCIHGGQLKGFKLFYHYYWLPLHLHVTITTIVFKKKKIGFSIYFGGINKLSLYSEIYNLLSEVNLWNNLCQKLN